MNAESNEISRLSMSNRVEWLQMKLFKSGIIAQNRKASIVYDTESSSSTNEIIVPVIQTLNIIDWMKKHLVLEKAHFLPMENFLSIYPVSISHSSSTEHHERF